MYIMKLINFGELVIGIYCGIVCNLMNMNKTNFKRHGLVPVAAVSTDKGSVTGDLSELVWIIGDCVDSIFILYLIIFAIVDLVSSISPSISPSSQQEDIYLCNSAISSCQCKTFNTVWWSSVNDFNARSYFVNFSSKFHCHTPVYSANCLASVKSCLHCFILFNGSLSNYRYPQVNQENNKSNNIKQW